MFVYLLLFMSMYSLCSENIKKSTGDYRKISYPLIPM